MPQVIVKSTADKFHYALETNKGRRPLIRDNCHHGADVVLRCAQEYHRLNSARRDDMIVPAQQLRQEHRERVERFERQHCHIRLCMEGNRVDGGFVVLSGELMGLHNVKPGTGDWMMREAIALGADRLDCFDVPHLIALYTKHGFREVLREPNHKKGGPAVVWMRRKV